MIPATLFELNLGLAVLFHEGGTLVVANAPAFTVTRRTCLVVRRERGVADKTFYLALHTGPISPSISLWDDEIDANASAPGRVSAPPSGR